MAALRFGLTPLFRPREERARSTPTLYLESILFDSIWSLCCRRGGGGELEIASRFNIACHNCPLLYGIVCGICPFTFTLFFQ